MLQQYYHLKLRYLMIGCIVGIYTLTVSLTSKYYDWNLSSLLGQLLLFFCSVFIAHLGFQIGEVQNHFFLLNLWTAETSKSVEVIKRELYDRFIEKNPQLFTYDEEGRLSFVGQKYDKGVYSFSTDSSGAAESDKVFIQFLNHIKSLHNDKGHAKDEKLRSALDILNFWGEDITVALTNDLYSNAEDAWKHHLNSIGLPKMVVPILKHFSRRYLQYAEPLNMMRHGRVKTQEKRRFRVLFIEAMADRRKNPQIRGREWPDNDSPTGIIYGLWREKAIDASEKKYNVHIMSSLKQFYNQEHKKNDLHEEEEKKNDLEKTIFDVKDPEKMIIDLHTKKDNDFNGSEVDNNSSVV